MTGISSTEYYRKNKLEGKVMHKCPHCDFTTPYNKSNLMNHIYAKHTAEKDRPYQCHKCERGFSQKLHLIKHLHRDHNIKDKNLEKKTINTVYIISFTEKIPNSKKTKARYEFYKKNNILKSNDLRENKYKYMDNLCITNKNLYYDASSGIIKINKINFTGKIKINCKCLKCIIKK